MSSELTGINHLVNHVKYGETLGNPTKKITGKEDITKTKTDFANEVPALIFIAKTDNNKTQR